MVKSDFSGGQINVFLTVQAAGATVAVLLRYWARRTKGAKLWWDDWLAIVSLACFWCFAAVGLAAVQHGLHKNRKLLRYDELKLQIRLMVASIEFTIATITFARLSVLMLYYRVFSTSRSMRRGLWVMAAATLAWWIQGSLVTLFQCSPIAYLFDPLTHGTCINGQLYFVIAESISCLISTVIVCMPIPLIWELNLQLPQKIAVGGLFLLGGFVAITSILRIIYTYHPELPRYDPMNAQLWLSLQLCSAIISACLPTLRPFLVGVPRRIRYSMATRNWGTMNHTKKNRNTSNGHHPVRSQKRIELSRVVPEPDEGDARLWNTSATSSENMPDTTYIYTTEVASGEGADRVSESGNAIHVKTEVSVV